MNEEVAPDIKNVAPDIKRMVEPDIKKVEKKTLVLTGIIVTAILYLKRGGAMPTTLSS